MENADELARRIVRIAGEVVNRYAWRIPAADKADVASDCVERMWKSRASDDTHLARIADLAVRDWRRKQARRVRIDEQKFAERAAEYHLELDHAERIDDNAFAQRMTFRLTRRPSRDLDVFDHFLDGWNVAEIARRYGVSETVIRRCRDRIREAYRAESDAA